MLIIRNEQLDAFVQASIRQFERRVLEHLRKFWPVRCARMGEEQVLSSIRQAVKRARAHGLEREIDIASYIDLVYLLGHDFDTNPETPYVGEILRSERHPARKMRDIYRRLKTERRL